MDACPVYQLHWSKEMSRLEWGITTTHRTEKQGTNLLALKMHYCNDGRNPSLSLYNYKARPKKQLSARRFRISWTMDSYRSPLINTTQNGNENVTTSPSFHTARNHETKVDIQWRLCDVRLNEYACTCNSGGRFQQLSQTWLICENIIPDIQSPHRPRLHISYILWTLNTATPAFLHRQQRRHLLALNNDCFYDRQNTKALLHVPHAQDEISRACKWRFESCHLLSGWISWIVSKTWSLRPKVKI